MTVKPVMRLCRMNLGEINGHICVAPRQSEGYRFSKANAQPGIYM